MSKLFIFIIVSTILSVNAGLFDPLEKEARLHTNMARPVRVGNSPSPSSPRNLQQVDLKRFLRVLLQLLQQFVANFLRHLEPTLSRTRREADEEAQSYMDAAVTGFGATFGKESCRSRVVCNVGRVLKERVPGAQVAVMVAESWMPESIREALRPLKAAVFEQEESCVDSYPCLPLGNFY